MLRFLIKAGHESVLEHEKITVLWECTRGVSHELVRHRIASYSQESQRYVKYNEVDFIEPIGLNPTQLSTWISGCSSSEAFYTDLLDLDCKPQDARDVLCNAARTKIAITANIREWRHIFKLRTSDNAHPQIKQMALTTLIEFKEAFPVLFEDIEYTLNVPLAQVVYE